ncbi:hypothetical protein AB0M43_20250 [Longispora sp. NPDC051575]|uniref:hypothetical protein n=1 Tax=Longispora sp. NPDC051575 TaxID=3154943 RepID=UPI003423B278
MRRNRALWRSCRDTVSHLAIPDPFDVGEFLDGLAAQRGRPIELVPVRAPTGSACGLLVSTDHTDYICYPEDTTPLHREHILLHEVGHLVRGHVGTTALDGVGALLPSLSAELVRRVLGRGGYTETQEQEAELIASLIARRVHRRRTDGPAEPRDVTVADGLARLRSVFESREHR